MNNNYKLFILSNIFAISFFGCKNNNKKTDINNEGNSTQYLDLVMNKSTSQTRNTNISAIRNFSTEVKITCGTRIGENLTEIITPENNIQNIVDTNSQSAMLPYPTGKDCDYEFQSFTISSQKYNAEKILLLKLKGNVIDKNTIKSYYKLDENNYISVSGSKIASNNKLELTLSDTIISIIDGQVIDSKTGDFITTKENVTIPINDFPLSINKLKAPDPLRIKAVNYAYQKDPSNNSKANLNFSSNNYSITRIDKNATFNMPTEKCIIISVANNFIMTWENINTLYTNGSEENSCSKIDLNIKNNWNNFADKTNLIILANTEENFENAYRVLKIGKMK